MVIKKVSLMGLSGVGKTTLIKMLTNQMIPKQHNPTIALDFQKIDFNGDFKISIWELGGQDQFQFMWDDFMKGSSLICVVSDSTEKNIKETKKILQRFSNKNQIIAIANKQDKKNVLSPQKIQETLGIETIGMVALDKSNRQTLLKVLENKMNSL
ncbi:MAG: GTP-binding protein [Candidatus Lokiarchaeota archaeon]|nr:GTP-binding protein [Candidatus Lokiarchaeota archaeon]